MEYLSWPSVNSGQNFLNVEREKKPKELIYPSRGEVSVLTWGNVTASTYIAIKSITRHCGLPLVYQFWTFCQLFPDKWNVLFSSFWSDSVVQGVPKLMIFFKWSLGKHKFLPEIIFTWTEMPTDQWANYIHLDRDANWPMGKLYSPGQRCQLTNGQLLIVLMNESTSIKPVHCVHLNKTVLYVHLSSRAKYPLWPPVCYDHLSFMSICHLDSTVATCLLCPPVPNFDHLTIVATYLLWPLLHIGHLSIVSTSQLRNNFF